MRLGAVGPVVSEPLTGVKGGEGSGHHGHVGRPGKRGGSLPGVGGIRATAYSGLNRYARSTTWYRESQYVSMMRDDVWKTHESYYRGMRVTTKGQIERGCIVSQGGKILWEAEGGKTYLDASYSTRYEDAIMTHSHPSFTLGVNEKPWGGGYDTKDDIHHGVSMPPSPADVMFAARCNLAEIRVAGLFQGSPIVFRVVRPESGWPRVKMAEIADRFVEFNRGWVERENPDELTELTPISRAALSFDILDAFWRRMQEDIGIEYVVDTDAFDA